MRYLFGTLVLLWSAASLVAEQTTAIQKNSQAFPRDASQHSIPAVTCATGSNTLLELGGVSRSTQHNGNDGQANFALKPKAGGAVLWKDQSVGQGVCFGFHTHMLRYVIGTRKEHGIGVRLTSVRYVDEATGKSQASSFNRRNIEGFAAVPSTDLHYIAFIAIAENDAELYVLDVEKDSVRKLGKAPLPPPLDEKERAYVKQHPDSLEGAWEWMGSFRDSYMDLEPGIITFQGDVLKVSFGADTSSKRSEKRNIVTYDLAKGK